MKTCDCFWVHTCCEEIIRQAIASAKYRIYVAGVKREGDRIIGIAGIANDEAQYLERGLNEKLQGLPETKDL